jgi:hypothetical protein
MTAVPVIEKAIHLLISKRTSGEVPTLHWLVDTLVGVRLALEVTPSVPGKLVATLLEEITFALVARRDMV